MSVNDGDIERRQKETRKVELTVTGTSTLSTLLSSTRISFAFAQRALTSLSGMHSHRLSCSICLSKLLMLLLLLLLLPAAAAGGPTAPATAAPPPTIPSGAPEGAPPDPPEGPLASPAEAAGPAAAEGASDISNQAERDGGDSPQGASQTLNPKP